MSKDEPNLKTEIASVRSEVEELVQVVEDLRREVSSHSESLGTLSQWIEKLGKIVDKDKK